ncbi:hypothetical protein [Bauldia litoralis]|uniref:Uncharacterized protein n=1 Tax=Bauldia litoralis TaxID=665467 RepID=A0A1G6CHU8_9HYPH|nr:hypothetical protein [Bauldia litoralis]SDB32362.1 hypothetical protein SAMN02982931_02510 [Bauldia litoralis]
MSETDKQKAAEILRKRRLAAEGLKETEGENPLEDPTEDKEGEEEIDDAALTTDLGLHR